MSIRSKSTKELQNKPSKTGGSRASSLGEIILNRNEQFFFLKKAIERNVHNFETHDEVREEKN